MLGLTRTMLQGFPSLVTAAKSGSTAYFQASSEHTERNTRIGERVSEIWKDMGVPACSEPLD